MAVLIGVAYGVSKTREAPSRLVGSGSGPGEFHGERIFGSSVTALYKEKDSALSKASREYADGVKTLKDAVDGLSKRLEKLESPKAAVVSALTAGMNATPGSVAPSQTATLGMANQGAPVQGSNGMPSSTVQVAGAPGRVELPAAPFKPRFRPGQEVPLELHPRPAIRGPATLSFPVKGEEAPTLGITLPAGSYVRAKMLTGVAAPEGRPYPVLLQLDYAHVLPNRKRLDLAGCFMVVKAQGDLSTERVQMQATKMSCVGRDGRMFERDIAGFVADDKDNNFAVAGEVVSKQDRVAVMAFLSSVVEGVGKAVQQAQTTQQVTPLGGSQSVLTGDEQRYIAAGGASNAAAMVSQWYLKQAQGLLPTINVNSGQNVWVVMQDSVSLPRDYFKNAEKGGNLEDSYSYVSRLVE